MPAATPTPGRHVRAGADRKRGQKYQNSFAYKHNKSSKKTEDILAIPVGGVCQRCYDQLQWRKTFRKFKPRKVFGKCNHCARKNIKNAYCTICRECAEKANCCAKCTKKKSIIQFEKTHEEIVAERQRLDYELMFMKERERRKLAREDFKANDKQYQRQLRRLAAGLSTDPNFDGGRETHRVSAGTTEPEEESYEEMAQPADMESQVAVLTAYYAVVEASKTPEAIRGIIDARCGEEPALDKDAWALLCAKLQLKYPVVKGFKKPHPLAMMAKKIEDELDFSDSGECSNR